MARLSGNKADPLPPLRRAHELLFHGPAELELSDARCQVCTVIKGLARPQLTGSAANDEETQNWPTRGLSSAMGTDAEVWST